MVISNLSQSLAKPLVMAKLNMAYLSSLKNRAKLLLSSLPVSPHCCPHCRVSKFLRPAQRYGDFKLITITCQAACHGKTEHGIFVKFKKPSKTAVVLIAGVSIIVVLIAPGTSSYHLVPKHLRRQRGPWPDFKLITITCLKPALSMAPTEHGIFVNV